MTFLFNKGLRILLITNALILVSGAMLGPIYALFVEKVGGSLLDASLTGGIFALVAGITTLVASKYADKIREERYIVAGGYFLMGIGFLLYMFVNSIWFLFIVQAIIGFAEAIYLPAFDSLYSRHLTRNKEGREWGAWEATNYFTAAAGAGIGGLLVTYFGFNIIFVIMGTLSIASAVYITTLKNKVL